jgi:hypothetical protein
MVEEVFCELNSFKVNLIGLWLRGLFLRSFIFGNNLGRRILLKNFRRHFRYLSLSREFGLFWSLLLVFATIQSSNSQSVVAFALIEYVL